jgi:hypothetical protein
MSWGRRAYLRITQSETDDDPERDCAGPSAALDRPAPSIQIRSGVKMAQVYQSASRQVKSQRHSIGGQSAGR